MRSTSSLLLVCLALGATLAACDPPNEDAFRMNGGAAPDPTGVITGTVLYVGPRPSCVRNEAGGVTEITGAVILTLFRFDNPPPPAGSATSAISLLTVPAESMFAAGDCMPADPTSEDQRTIMRSAPFTWPEIALGHQACTRLEDGTDSCPGQAYQVRGFYDYDGDFNPFFGLRNLPTAGDIGGGAFIDISVSPPQPLEIQFGHVTQETNGQVVEGVAVTLGAVVNTERPIFEVLDQTRAMSSSAVLPGGADPIARERQLLELTNMRLTAIVSATQPTPSEQWLRALTAAGIDSTNYRFGVPEYGYYITNVDANADGMPDGHPILGTAGILYFTPVIIVKRVRNPIETLLRLPEIVTVGSIRPTVQRGLPTLIPRENMMAFDAVIAPVAVMITNPDMPALCRAPIIPPGNTAETYSRIWNDCQDFPTGNYDINVLNGIAGGQAVNVRERCIADCIAAGSDMATCNSQCDFTSPLISDNGWTFEGGQYSSQAWSIPNDLGCPDTQYRPAALNQIDDVRADGSLPVCGEVDGDGNPATAMLPFQSRQAGWSVVDDGAPFGVPGDDYVTASTTAGHGIATCAMAPPAAGGPPVPVTFMPPPLPECCPTQLDKFCGLPLCPLRDASTIVPLDPAVGFGTPTFPAEGYPYPQAVREHASGARQTREIRVPGEDYRIEANGSITPLCTPFLMPVACCQLAASDPDR